ncbi:hypothetical protein A0U93_13660 [Neoasaia chiangmaiensis]|uniref:Uncharacterized protein n=1 Tax=Neoasaia chiangmaiensis TaxID=320497 RepID=A0A1U9KSK9_9PROT|nr:hypothetical protein A0U93_13660 [Neoasaia chiangmaiensis]
MRNAAGHACSRGEMILGQEEKGPTRQPSDARHHRGRTKIRFPMIQCDATGGRHEAPYENVVQS